MTAPVIKAEIKARDKRMCSPTFPSYLVCLIVFFLWLLVRVAQPLT